MIEVFNIVLMAFMVILALATLRMKDLFGATMMMGIFSLASAGWLTMMDAVDVAFTEAAVGAGISTVLVLATLAITASGERDARKTEHSGRWRAMAVVLITGAVLLYATRDMPAYGDPNAPIHIHVATHYLNESPAEMDIPNIVTSVLAAYRGYDTFGETTVIFTAGVGVLLLLSRRSRKERS